MLQSEFETLTDILPDALLYDAAEHEYMTGDWDSKAGFCHDFKFDGRTGTEVPENRQ